MLGNSRSLKVNAEIERGTQAWRFVFPSALREDSDEKTAAMSE